MSAVKSAHLHSARSDKDGKWPAFACLFHFFNSGCSSSRRFCAGKSPAKLTHAEKYTLRERFVPPSSSLMSRWQQEPRGRIVRSIDCRCSIRRISLSRREEPRPSGIFIRRRVIRRSVSLSLESNGDTRRGEPENIALSSGHDLIVRNNMCFDFFE